MASNMRLLVNRLIKPQSQFIRLNKIQLRGIQRLSDQLTPNEKGQTHDEAIYKGLLAAQIKLVKGFSLMTSVIGLSCQPVLYYHMQNGASVGLVAFAGSFLAFFTFATPLLLHTVCKKYVTEMYYNKMEDSYTAITYSLLLRKKETKFRASEVYVPDLPGAFTTFKANNVPLFIDSEVFMRANHYHFGKIMGYDKPLDLKMEKLKDKDE